jgi:hypothetical protein
MTAIPQGQLLMNFGAYWDLMWLFEVIPEDAPPP